MTYPSPQDPRYDPNTPAGYQYQSYPGYSYPQQSTRSTSGLAVASLVTSILAFVLCSGLTGFIGAILGHMARRRIKETGQEGDGLALAGIIIGWIGTILAVLALGVA